MVCGSLLAPVLACFFAAFCFLSLRSRCSALVGPELDDEWSTPAAVARITTRAIPKTMRAIGARIRATLRCRVSIAEAMVSPVRGMGTGEPRGRKRCGLGAPRLPHELGRARHRGR